MDTPRDTYARPARRGPSAGAVVFLAIIFGVIAGFGGAILALWADRHHYLAEFLPQVVGTAETAAPSTAVRTTGGNQSSSPSTFAQIARELDQSVVNIDTTSQREAPVMWPFGGGGTEKVSGRGTGIIVDTQGYILTNFHVAGDAQHIDVTVMHPSGPKKYPARLIGGDQRNDLAVIKIDAKGLKPARFGNSEALEPGDWVMAIGNPYGFEHTVSVGVVSALNRPLQLDESTTFYGLIQTDAAINPGNSGGPLVNANGDVIGVNTVLFLGQGNGGPQANGIGFAIPSNKVVSITNQLRRGGRVQHPYIGIGYELITDEVRRQERLPVKDGIIVLNVYPKSPAAQAGLQKADLILSVDGKPLRDKNTLGEYLNKQQVGKTIALKVKRWNDAAGAWEDKTAHVKIGNMPNDFARSMQPEPQAQPAPQQEPQREGGFPFSFPF